MTQVRMIKEVKRGNKAKGRRRQKEVRGWWKGPKRVNLVMNVRDSWQVK